MTPGAARMMRVTSVGSAALPFAFAIAAAWLPRHDLRFLWLAIAGLVGLLLVRQFTRRRATIGAAAVTLAVALVLQAIVIRMMMSALPVGALVVALGFSLCFSFSHALATLSAYSTPSTTPATETPAR